jgi:hypothetical protein
MTTFEEISTLTLKLLKGGKHSSDLIRIESFDGNNVLESAYFDVGDNDVSFIFGAFLVCLRECEQNRMRVYLSGYHALQGSKLVEKYHIDFTITPYNVMEVEIK